MEVKRRGAGDGGKALSSSRKPGTIVLPNTTWTPADPEAYQTQQVAIDHLKELEFAEKGANPVFIGAGMNLDDLLRQL